MRESSRVRYRRVRRVARQRWSPATKRKCQLVTHVCRRSKLLTSNPSPLLFGAGFGGFRRQSASRSPRRGERRREAGTRPHDLRRTLRTTARPCSGVRTSRSSSRRSRKRKRAQERVAGVRPAFCAGAASERLRAWPASASNEDVDFYAALGDTESRVDDRDHRGAGGVFAGRAPAISSVSALLATRQCTAGLVRAARAQVQTCFIVPRTSTRSPRGAAIGEREPHRGGTARTGGVSRRACPSRRASVARCAWRASTLERRAAILRIATRALLSASRPSTWCGTCTTRKRNAKSPRRGAKSSKRENERSGNRRDAVRLRFRARRPARGGLFRAIFQDTRGGGTPDRHVV